MFHAGDPVTLGGPGASDVQFALGGGKYIQTLVDSALADPNGAFFDIIGFDPRGINNTTPASDCFPDSFS
jgi:hypothetical protein